MNIEKIFNALNNDEMNSSLGTICAELEKQGYSITINNIEVTAEEFFDRRSESLEQSGLDFNFLLKKDDKVEQEFSISFIDYHKILLREKESKLNYKLPDIEKREIN